MQACGIITEYNPFHNGHIYHIEQTRKLTNCDCLIAVMSGNFVQRGEPAIIDKWQRAKTAIQHGVDIVIELPYSYATQSADIFAKGAIQALMLANVNSIVFGSECNDIEMLTRYSKLSETLTIQKTHTLAKSFAQQTDVLASNDLLGISYLKALRNTNIHPYTIKRTNSYHELTYEKKIASASAIRHALALKKDVQHATCMAQQLNTSHLFKHYYPYLQTLLITMHSTDLSHMLLVNEGIEQLLQANALRYDDLCDFLNACTSKRYTRSRIQRTLIQIMTQTKKSEIQALSPFQHLRVLAFNDIGRNYLATLRKQEQLIIASRFNQIPKDWRKIELRATQAYAYPLPLSQRKEAIAQEWQSALYIR